MSNPLMEQLLKVFQKPDPQPFLFAAGQTVRVNKSVADDGQTPEDWAGALAKVLRQKSSSLSKNHWYSLKHLANGNTCDVSEEDIDMRYARINP